MKFFYKVFEGNKHIGQRIVEVQYAKNEIFHETVETLHFKQNKEVILGKYKELISYKSEYRAIGSMYRKEMVRKNNNMFLDEKNNEYYLYDKIVPLEYILQFQKEYTRNNFFDIYNKKIIVYIFNKYIDDKVKILYPTMSNLTYVDGYLSTYENLNTRIKYKVTDTQI